MSLDDDVRELDDKGRVDIGNRFPDNPKRGQKFILTTNWTEYFYDGISGWRTSTTSGVLTPTRIRSDANPYLTGDVTFNAGQATTFVQVGQTITTHTSSGYMHNWLSGVTPSQHHTKTSGAGEITSGVFVMARIPSGYMHGWLSGVTANQHHTQIHATSHISGGTDPVYIYGQQVNSGVIADAQIPDVETLSYTNPFALAQIPSGYLHNWLSGITASQHHAKTSGVDISYHETQVGVWANPSGATWNGKLVTVHNSTQSGYRIYTYSNGGWRSVAVS